MSLSRKFLCLSILLILLLLSFNLPKIKAQGSPDEAQKNYTDQFTKYRESYEKYNTARYTYLSFQTAESKNEAFLTTRDYLDQVDDLYISYLALVKETWTNSITSSDENTKISQNLDSEVDYLKSHKQKLAESQTLESLPDLAQELKDHIGKTTLPRINKAQAFYEITRANTVLVDFNDLATTLKQFAISHSSQGENSTFLANWDTEIESIRKNAQDQKQLASNEFSKKEEDTLDSSQLEAILEYTQASKNYLSKSTNLFEEILKSI